MEHFINIITDTFDKHIDNIAEGLSILDNHYLTESCDEYIVYDTVDNKQMIKIPLTRELTNEEADNAAETLSIMFTQFGYTDFDIEISGNPEGDI